MTTSTTTKTAPEATAEETKVAKKVAAPKFDDCPRCGFHFSKPQAHCNVAAACANRAAIRNGEPLPGKPEKAEKATPGMKVAPAVAAANERAAARKAAEDAKAAKPATKVSGTRPGNKAKAESIAARKAAANIVD